MQWRFASRLPVTTEPQLRMSEVTKANRPFYCSQIHRNKSQSQKQNKDPGEIGDAFERWRRLKAERNLRTDARITSFLLDR